MEKQNHFPVENFPKAALHSLVGKKEFTLNCENALPRVSRELIKLMSF
jgi:hypothetical protein